LNSVADKLTLAACARNAIEDLLGALADSDSHASTIEASKRLLVAIDDDFDLQPGTGSTTTAEQLKAMKLASRRQKRKLSEARQQVVDMVADKVAGRIQHIWLVRVGFAHPSTPLRSITDFCRDFQVEESKAISFPYVAAVRDAFCEVIKEMYSARVSKLAAADDGTPVTIFLTHIHDEALMKMRSSLTPEGGDAGGSSLSRSRFSKIQNNVMVVSCGSGSVRFPLELQALLRKDADTIATAIISVVNQVTSAFPARTNKINLVHLVTGTHQ
jgi:hypothetical protein